MYTAEEVLKEYRVQFIADIDANAVVHEFLNKGIIPVRVQRNISKTDSPKQQNEILHVYLAENMHQRSIDDGLWHNHFCTRQPKDVCLGQRHAEEAGIRYASPEDSLLKLRMTCLSLLRHIPVCLLFLTWTDYATLFL